MNLNNILNYRPVNILKAEGTKKFRMPYYDVGEFLPKMKKGFFEIARICLASSTGDVISIRVKKNIKSYRVEVVDEYETEFIEFNDKYQEIPTQGDVIDIIMNLNHDYDSQEFLYGIIQQNEFKTIDEIIDFIYLDSNFYPDLNQLFIHRLKENGFKNTTD